MVYEAINPRDFNNYEFLKFNKNKCFIQEYKCKVVTCVGCPSDATDIREKNTLSICINL